MRSKLIFILAIVAVFFTECKESNTLDVPKQKDEITFDDSPVDKKLKYMYEKYDVIISYKWDRNVFAPNAMADPAAATDVLPYVEMMEEVFFKALEKVQVKGSDFAKKETPLNFYLLGSGINYGEPGNFGESTVGQAGNIQPNRLTLGGLTEYGKIVRNGSDEEFIKASINISAFGFPSEGGLVGFLYHEFTHYMDAKHDIPKDFEKPAFNNYLRGTNAYTKVSYDNARKRGFMLPYGMQNEHEDFATYVQL
ncbi:MAG: putative zinc-binding metallopeptidase, partial [Polaribacter sp.]